MARYYLLRTGQKNIAFPMRVFDNPNNLKIFTSELGWRIFQEFLEPNCPIDVAKKLGIHEQKVYYYIRKFRKARIIREVGKEPRKGTIARFYQVKDYAFGVKLEKAPEEESISVTPPQYVKNLEPFIRHGNLNARIIVGSPDPHGPWKARASDSCCAIDFALFIGAFTTGKSVPNYKLDIETRESDLKGNIILIGGPTANMITNRVNKKLKIRFILEGETKIQSTLSKRTYGEEENGVIITQQNPFDRKGKMLLLAGKRFQGTRAAILAFIKDIEKIIQGNKFSPEAIAKVVRGFDMDGDGIIDSAEFLE